jgi:hypothetical protein
VSTDGTTSVILQTRSIGFAGPCHLGIRTASVGKLKGTSRLGTLLHLIRKLLVFVQTSQNVASIPRFLPYSPRSTKCSLNLLFRQDSNLVGCDVIHRLYQGLAYFQNIVWFHVAGVNVISFTPIRDVRPSPRPFHWNSIELCPDLLRAFLPTLDNKYGKYEEKFVHVPYKSLAFTALIFTKPSQTMHFVDISYAEIYLNRNKNLDSTC